MVKVMKRIFEKALHFMRVAASSTMFNSGLQAPTMEGSAAVIGYFIIKMEGQCQRPLKLAFDFNSIQQIFHLSSINMTCTIDMYVIGEQNGKSRCK